jgi:hypothetical protein
MSYVHASLAGLAIGSVIGFAAGFFRGFYGK